MTCPYETSFSELPSTHIYIYIYIYICIYSVCVTPRCQSQVIFANNTSTWAHGHGTIRLCERTSTLPRLRGGNISQRAPSLLRGKDSSSKLENLCAIPRYGALECLPLTECLEALAASQYSNHSSKAKIHSRFGVRGSPTSEL